MFTRTLIMRCEESTIERRAPLAPEDSGRLIQAGYHILVESSPQRIFADRLYQAQGCQIVPRGTWMSAAPTTTIVGIKALSNSPESYRNTHIYFAHAYRGQTHSSALLNKFKTGGGTLLDIEYLVDSNGGRLVSFSRYAGMAGVIAGLNALLPSPYALTDSCPLHKWQERFQEQKELLQQQRNLVTGAEGRCGGGVCSILEELQLPFERWTLADTMAQRPYSDLRQYNVVFHCAGAFNVQPPMLTLADTEGSALRLIVDVTCDMGNPFNLLLLNHTATSFLMPVQWIQRKGTPLPVIAIDHLPNLLPLESSTGFSAQLLPLLMHPEHDAWQASVQRFQIALSQNGGAA